MKRRHRFGDLEHDAVGDMYEIVCQTCGDTARDSDATRLLSRATSHVVREGGVI